MKLTTAAGSGITHRHRKEGAVQRSKAPMIALTDAPVEDSPSALGTPGAPRLNFHQFRTFISMKNR